MQTAEHSAASHPLSSSERPSIHFLIHDDADNVAVAVVDLRAGEKAHGVSLESRNPTEIEVKMNIPLGHKIALKDIAAGDTMTKYGVDCGKFVAPAKKGEHVHVHNAKTKRW